MLTVIAVRYRRAFTLTSLSSAPGPDSSSLNHNLIGGREREAEQLDICWSEAPAARADAVQT
jgi:hypothetical protein